MNVTAMRGRGAAFALAAQAGPAADSAPAHMKAAAGGLQVAQGAALRTMLEGAIPQVRVRLERARQFRSSLGGA